MTYCFKSLARSAALATSAPKKLSPIAAALQPMLWAGLALGMGAAQAQTTPTAPVKTLGEITVLGNQDATGLPKANAGGQTASGGGLGILGNTSTLDSPFSSINYTTELVQDQQARTLADVVVNDPSVRVLTSSGGFGDDFLIRGFAVPSGDVGLNGLYGLTSSSRVSTEFVERVEVLKGPGALLNGIAPNGSIGGGINVVTKRAADVPLTRLTTTYRSDAQFGTHLDAGRRFGTDNQWGIRVNASGRDGDTAIDDQKQKVVVGSVGLDYIGSRIRWSLDAFTQREDITGGLRPQFNFAAGTFAIPDALPGSANILPGTDLHLKDETIATKVEFDITDRLTGFAAIGVREGEAQQLFANGPVRNTAGDFLQSSGNYDSYSKTTSANAGLRGKFSTGPVGHTVVASVSTLEQEAGNVSYAASTRPSNIYNPVRVPNPGLSQSPRKASDTTLNSFAIADTLSMFGDRLLVTAGLRQQSVKAENYSTTTGARTSGYDAKATSPLFGVVFKVADNISVYGNASGGLTRGAVAPATTANAGQVFPPFKSKQYEAGVKAEFSGVTTTASVFQIARPNALTDAATNVYSFDGEQRNRGLELSAYGEAARGVRLIGGVAFNDAKLTKTTGGVNQGNKPAGVPDYTANLGGEWDVPAVTGYTVNARAVYTSSVYYAADNRRSLPGWTRFDIGARYKTVIAGKSTVFRANIENVANKNAWVLSGTYVSSLAPRTFVLSAAVDF